jgi:hypothetical protein
MPLRPKFFSLHSTGDSVAEEKNMKRSGITSIQAAIIIAGLFIAVIIAVPIADRWTNKIPEDLSINEVDIFVDSMSQRRVSWMLQDEFRLNYVKPKGDWWDPSSDVIAEHERNTLKTELKKKIIKDYLHGGFSFEGKVEW